MHIILSLDCTAPQRRHIIRAVHKAGCRVEESFLGRHSVLTVVGDLDRVRRIPLGVYPGVQKVLSLTGAHMLVGLEHQRDPTVVQLDDVKIGGGSFAMIAGPCAVENGDQLLETARAVKEAGAQILRGGTWKPRTSPYSFRGLGLSGLRLLREVSRELEMPCITEVMDPRHVEAVISNADMLQIGTRNMSNFDLLVEVGRTGHPVLLKRGRSATIADWLNAAEYIVAQGNSNVVLCERGIRGFDPVTRNVLDLAAIPAVRERSHLPIMIDPSHATGNSSYVAPLSRAACAAGADGLMVEVHVNPQVALSDAEQAMVPSEFAELCEDLRLLSKMTHRPTRVEDTDA